MCFAQLILNAELVNAGAILDLDEYVVRVCSKLYVDAMDWVEFWTEWNTRDDAEYWITDEYIDYIYNYIINAYEYSTPIQKHVKKQLCSTMRTMKQNTHYTIYDNNVNIGGVRMWNKNGASRLIDIGDADMRKVLNTLDHVASLYDDYLECLNLMGYC